MVIGLADDLAVIVISDGRITGIVTVSRLRQIIRRPAPPPHRPGNLPVHAGRVGSANCGGTHGHAAQEQSP